MAVAALPFLLTGAAILWWQRRAATCPKHSRSAGTAAWLLGGLSLLAGLALLFL